MAKVILNNNNLSETLQNTGNFDFNNVKLNIKPDKWAKKYVNESNFASYYNITYTTYIPKY